MIDRKGDIETANDVMEEALEHTFLMPDEKDALRERMGHALLLEALETVHVLNSESALEVKPERGLGCYIAMTSLPLCLLSYALFIYFGAWAAPAFLLPGAAVIIGMLIDEKE